MAKNLPSIALLSLGLAGSFVGAEKADRLFYANDFPEFCQAGTKQSPINVPAHVEELGHHLRPELTFPTVLHPSVTDDGHGFKVTWDEPHEGVLPKLVAGGSGLSDILLDPSIHADLSVEMEPIQFHVHFPAEHVVDNKLFAGELHIVSLVSKGSAPAEWGCDEHWDDPENNEPNFSKCAAVFGVLFELGDSTPEYLMDLLDSAPTLAHETVPLQVSKSIDLQSLLPTSLSHYTYFGSLTTPPCVEGVRWHLFKTPVPITVEAMKMGETKLANTRITSDGTEVLGFRTNNRFTQPLNGRKVFVVNESKHHSGKHHSRKLGEYQ